MSMVDGILYTLLELTNVVTAHLLPISPVEPTLLGRCMTSANIEPTMFVGELLLRYPFLYVSNRDSVHAGGDTIGIINVANPAKMELIREVRTGLKHLRSFEIHEPWLIVGGVLEGGIKMYEITEGGNNLIEIAANPHVVAPTAFLWLD